MKKEVSCKRNFLYHSTYQIVRIMIPIITTPYLSRVIGARGIGFYSYAVSVATYFMMFIRLGLANYGKRQIAFSRNDRRNMSEVFWNIYCMQFFLLIFFSIFYFCYCVFVANEKIYAFVMFPYVISAGLDITWLFFGLEQFKTTTVRDMLVKIISTIIIFICIKNEHDSWKYSLIVSISFFISQLILWTQLRKYVDWVVPSWDKVKSHVKPNLILFIPTVAVSIYKIMDKIMLGLLSTKVEIGFYESSERILQIPMALIESLGIVMAPRMMYMFKNSKKQDEASYLFEKSVIFSMFLSSSLSLGIMSVTDIFVPLFYGTGFEKCKDLYYILLPSCLFLAFANVIRTQYLLPKEKDKQFIVSLIIGAVINLLFNLLFIPSMGALGVAVGTLVAEMVVCVVQVISVWNELPILKYLLKTSPFLVSGIVMLFCSFFINVEKNWHGFFIKIVACGTIYMFSIIVLHINKIIKMLVR